MNIGVFAKINRYAINTDPQLVRTHEAYGEIQKELNKTFGAPDWARIKQQVNRLGDGAGIGVLAAAYYTVAAAKTESLSGLAAGLEMLGAALLVDDGDKPPYATLRWMLSNLRDMLHELPTDDAALRDLYRCERMSNTLLRYLQNHRQEDAVPGIYLLERILAQKIQAVKTHTAQAHAHAGRPPQQRRARPAGTSSTTVRCGSFRCHARPCPEQAGGSSTPAAEALGTAQALLRRSYQSGIRQQHRSRFS